MAPCRISLLCIVCVAALSACDQEQPASPPSGPPETVPVPMEQPRPLPSWTKAPLHPSNPEGNPDFNDPASVARAVLTAYRRPHRGRVRELSARHRQRLEEEIDQDPHGLAAQAYDDRYLQAARTWSGDIGPIRMRGRFAYCRFGTDDHENVYIVELAQEGERWMFSQIGIMSRDEWEADPDDPVVPAATDDGAEPSGEL